ncbi:MAG: AsmA family protein [Inquilinus sp.]|nr:AsmA family protein [Inquilinus sp.]
MRGATLGRGLLALILRSHGAIPWRRIGLLILRRVGSRNLWLTVFGVLAFLIGAPIVAIKTVDVEHYRGIIEDQSKAMFGRRLTIEGGIELELSTSPAIAVRDVVLENVEGGSRPEMARIGELAIGVRLLPLFIGRLRMTHLEIRDADLILETGADGLGNWVLARGEEAAGEEPDGEPSAALPAFDRIALRDTTLTYVGLFGRRRVLEVDEATLQSVESGIEVSAVGAFQGVKVRVNGKVGTMAALQDRVAEWPMTLALRAGGNRLDLSGTVGDPWAFDDLEMEVAARIVSFAALATLGSDGRSPARAPTLPELRATARISGGARSLRIAQLRARMGDSDLSGELRITRIDGKPTIAGALLAERIALEDFANRDRGRGRGGRLPIRLLREVDADIEIAIDRIGWGDIAVRDLAAELRLQGGQLNTDVVKAELWDGWWSGRIAADAMLEPLAANVDVTVGQLDLTAMLAHYGVGDTLHGHLDGAMSLHGRGDTVAALLDTANGRFALDMGTGQINSGSTALLGRSLLTTLLPGSGSGPPITQINCAVGHFEVAEGVARSTALLVDTTRVTVGGEGAIDFGGGRLDLLLNPRTKDPNLLALVAPVRVYGQFDGVQVSLVTGELVIDAATSLLLGAINPFAIVIPFVTAGTGQDNPCLTAIVSQDVMSPRSAPERMLGGAATVVEGFAEGLGEAANDLGAGLGAVIDGLFGRRR